MARLELHGLCVIRGGVQVLHGVDLDVSDGERVVLLGASGSGKSTLLRAVAGLDPIAAGRVAIDGRDVGSLPSRERDVAMMDQQASLQPHLDVRRNVAFPLTLRRLPAGEVDTRVEAEARAWSFLRLLRRRPATLSTGERHEVALARSLVRRASVVLLDEPFANHDAPRRSSLVRDLIGMQEGYGATMVCVTNDPRVMMGLAERCGVLDGGRILQLGTPAEVFARPVSRFVAGLVGSPPMNLVPGRVERAVSGVRIVAGPLRVRSFVPAVSDLVGSHCTVGIRPTDLHRPRTHDLVTIEEAVRSRAFLGPETEVRLAGGEQDILAVVAHPVPEPGSLLRLAVDPAAIHVFGPDGAAVAHGV